MTSSQTEGIKVFEVGKLGPGYRLSKKKRFHQGRNGMKKIKFDYD